MKQIKFIISLLILLILVGCTPNFSYENENDVKSQEDLLNCVVTINSYESSSFLGFSRNVGHLGTGIVIGYDENYYYILTCNHVIYTVNKSDGYYVNDRLGNKAEAKIIKHSANYDLALLRVSKDIEVNIITLANENIEIDEYVKAVDNYFVITEGVVEDYVKGMNLQGATLNTNVRFDVIQANCHTHPGSSGGPLLNENNQLVGIVYAEYKDEFNNWVCCYSIPLEKVKQFLN